MRERGGRVAAVRAQGESGTDADGGGGVLRAVRWPSCRVSLLGVVGGRDGGAGPRRAGAPVPPGALCAAQRTAGGRWGVSCILLNASAGPEPSVWAYGALCCVCLLWRGRRGPPCAPTAQRCAKVRSGQVAQRPQQLTACGGCRVARRGAQPCRQVDHCARRGAGVCGRPSPGRALAHLPALPHLRGARARGRHKAHRRSVRAGVPLSGGRGRGAWDGSGSCCGQAGMQHL